MTKLYRIETNSADQYILNTVIPGRLDSTRVLGDEKELVQYMEHTFGQSGIHLTYLNIGSALVKQINKLIQVPKDNI